VRATPAGHALRNEVIHEREGCAFRSAPRRTADGANVQHGTDTFVIRDGLIRAQRWYYRVESD